MRCNTLVLTLAALSLAACSDRLVEAPPLGGAVAQNNAVQIVDPTPAATEEPLPMNGGRNDAAMTRYEKGKVIKPVDVRTSDAAGGGSR